MPPSRARTTGSGLSRPARVGLGVLAAIVFVLFVSMWGIARFYTDYLWFDALDFEGVWKSVLFTKIALSFTFIGLVFVAVWANLYLADRLAPTFRPTGPDEELLRRYQDAVSTRPVLVRSGIALFLALFTGASASTQWENWVLFNNSSSVGITDPQFGRDVGFYLFRLPMWSWLASWGFRAIFVILVVTAIAHYLNGGIRVQPGAAQIVSTPAKAHLSVLLALLALVKAAGYWLDRFHLVTSNRGAVQGATTTDIKAQLPATNLLILVALLAFVLFIANIWRKGWVLPALVTGLWIFTSVVVAAIFPALYQRLVVEPSESTKEAIYIDRNIGATRDAFGLDISVEPYPYTPDLDAAALADNEATIRNIRLLDPGIVQDTFERLEAERAFYEFADLDVDRYEINGVTTQVVIGARTVKPGETEQPSWDNETLAFTHGYGVALSAANGVDASGRPDFAIKGVPQRNTLGIPIDQPQLYMGENLDGYAIVGTDREEIDYVADDGTQVNFRYDGEGGVPLGGFLRRAAFSLRFAEINPLVSGQLNSESRVLYVRDVRDRAEKLAPFLHYDNDPYPVIHDGRIVYLLDAYTTSNDYPYSQSADIDSIPRGSGLAHRFNYVRNSVKVVVDGFDGSVTFYVVDETDPLINAWRSAFPELFTDFSEMPEDLLDHLRYPEDLFRVQTNMWGRYHVTDPVSFYGRANEWEVAQDPGEEVVSNTPSLADSTETESSTGVIRPTDLGRIDPYYQLMRLPGEPDEEFVVLRSFVPRSPDSSRPELTAFMVAKSDPENYGELIVYEMPGTDVDGPLNVHSNILTEEAIADRITQLNQQGSEVKLANLLLIPIENSILYVRPLYVQADGNAPIPELKAVIVAHDDQVVIDATLRGALEQLFGSAPETLQEEPEPDDDSPTTDDGPDEPSTTIEVPDDVAELLSRAGELFSEADAALNNGDLGDYQDKVNEASALVDRAAALLN